MNDADAIASAVLEEFSNLPAKRKPSVRDNGLHEWVPMAGIVAKGPNGLKCVALATGMKCLPASKLPQANGVAIHDWHAEILAIRAFNRFILEECRRLALQGDGASQSEFIYRRITAQHENQGQQGTPEVWQGQPFAWREDVSLHMYCSEAPCGDASMELIMAAQDDASPWEIPSPTPGDLPTQAQAQAPTPASADGTPLPGRAYFSQLGIVRRKPSRGDAPPSLSKSCSDKLALKQVTSLLSSLTSALVSPTNAYLSSVILPESQYSAAACSRCFSSSSTDGGRMAPLLATSASAKLEDAGYAFREFRVDTTKMEFAFSRRAILPPNNSSTDTKDMADVKETKPKKLIASNLATSWILNGPRDGEGLVGGVLQGRKQFDLRGASLVSRRKMWTLAREICSVMALDDDGEIKRVLGSTDLVYDEIKDGSSLLEGRRRAKEETKRVALKGWVRNSGGGKFKLE